MTTVGYGDYFPTQVGGYIGGAIVMVIGLMVTALPIAIIGSNFTVCYEYNLKLQKRKTATQKSSLLPLSYSVSKL